MNKSSIKYWRIEARKQAILRKVFKYGLDINKYSKWVGTEFILPL